MLVAGGLQEAMVEQYNDQLRELREHNMADVSEAFRQTVRELRDEERTPPGAVQVYGLMSTVLLIVFYSHNVPFTWSAALERDEIVSRKPWEAFHKNLEGGVLMFLAGAVI